MYDAIFRLIGLWVLAAIVSIVLLANGIHARRRRRAPWDRPAGAGSVIAITIGAIGAAATILLPLGLKVSRDIQDAHTVTRAKDLVSEHLKSLSRGPIVDALGAYSGMELQSSERWSHPWDIQGFGAQLVIEGRARFARGEIPIHISVSTRASPPSTIDRVQLQGAEVPVPPTSMSTSGGEREAISQGQLYVDVSDFEFKP